MCAIQLCLRENIKISEDGPSATFCGLTFWDSERFVRKWSTFLYHPERGLANTALTVKFNNEFFTISRENFKTIKYDENETIPTVFISWGIEKKFDIEEKFFVPTYGKLLIRKVKIINKTETLPTVAFRLMLYPNFGLFDEIYTDEKSKLVVAKGYTIIKLTCIPTENIAIKTSGRYDLWVEIKDVDELSKKEVTFIYSIQDVDENSSFKNEILSEPKILTIIKETKKYWDEKTQIETDNRIINHLFFVSRNNLKATLSKSGKRDSGIWQYNMEWVRDDSMFLIGLLMCGFFNEARVMLEKLLGKFVGPEGQTIESSRWFGYELAELDQNGQLLYALWTYVCWTGDFSIIKKYWEKIKLVAEFPIKDVFRNKVSKLLKNKREFWERTDVFGVEEGYELAYQFWVSLGLSKASELAYKINERKFAERWLNISQEIKDAMLYDPKFKLIEDNHFIKRRKANGEWQKYLIPPDRARMPNRSPIAVEEKPSAEPDTSEVLPIIYNFIPSNSELAIETVEWVEKLWNQRWDYGGYERYDSSSEPEPPGPWPFASIFVAKANLEIKNYDRAWRVLNWLYNINGGKSGAWFEYYSVDQLTPPLPPVGFIGWTWAEIVSFIIYHIIGVRPKLEHLKIKPHFLPQLNYAKCLLNIRKMKIYLTIQRGRTLQAKINDKPVQIIDGSITLPYVRNEFKINFEIT